MLFDLHNAWLILKNVRGFSISNKCYTRYFSEGLRKKVPYINARTKLPKNVIAHPRHVVPVDTRNVRLRRVSYTAALGRFRSPPKTSPNRGVYCGAFYM